VSAPYAETALEPLRGPLTGYCYRMLATYLGRGERFAEFGLPQQL
jgi:hypothetical protein